MKKLVIVAWLALTGCASAPPQVPMATEEEKAAAARLYVVCLAANAEDLDDGISDAGSVGAAVAAACRRERRAQIDVSTRGGMESLRLEMYDDADQADAVRGTRMVLDTRRRRAGTPVNP